MLARADDGSEVQAILPNFSLPECGAVPANPFPHITVDPGRHAPVEMKKLAAAVSAGETRFALDTRTGEQKEYQIVAKSFVQLHALGAFGI